MKISAFIEHTQSVIRFGPGCDEHGKSYTGILSMVKKGDEAYFYALCMYDKKKFGKADWLAIKQILIDEKIKKVTWERKNNEDREVVFYL